MRVLTINKSYIPIRLTSKFSAIGKFYSGLVEGMYIRGETWEPKSWEEWEQMSIQDIWPEDQEFVNSTRQRYAVPKVIRTLYYDKIPKHSIRLTRKALYDRDGYRCYICGKEFSERKLSIDHIIPLSRGGGNSWENMITCCTACNFKKGDKLLSELGLKPHFQAFKPNISNIQKLKADIGQYDPSWSLFGI